MGPAGVEEQASHLGMRCFCTGWRCWLPKVGTSFAPWSSYIGLYKCVWSCDPSDEHGGMNIHCRGAKHHGGCCRLNNGLLWGGLSSLVPQLPRITCGNHDVCDGNDRKDDDDYYHDDDGYGDDENNADHEDNGSYHQTKKIKQHECERGYAMIMIMFMLRWACAQIGLLTFWQRAFFWHVDIVIRRRVSNRDIAVSSRFVGCSTRGWTERIRCDE